MIKKSIIMRWKVSQRLLIDFYTITLLIKLEYNKKLKLNLNSLIGILSNSYKRSYKSLI